MSTDADDSGLPETLKNPNLIGQEAAEQTFLSAFNSAKLPHAWLLCGPKGIGKATLAYRIARFVLMKGGAGGDDGPGLFGDDLPEDTPSSLHTDPDDPLFHRIASGGHGDMMFLQRIPNERPPYKLNRDINVNQVRKIGSFLSKTASEGGWRVVVIDSADDLNTNSANALLKVLEEPPKRALLILVSHRPGRLLATIHSRCRRLMLTPLAESDVETLLRRYDEGIEESDIGDLVRIADGSIGRALVLSTGNGLDIYRDIQTLLGGLPKIDVPALHRLGDKVARDNTGDSFRTAADMINRWLAGHIKDHGSLGLDPWFEVWEKTNRLYQQTDSLNLDRKQVMLDTFLSIEAAW